MTSNEQSTIKTSCYGKSTKVIIIGNITSDQDFIDKIDLDGFAHALLSLAYQGAAGETYTSLQKSLGVPNSNETALAYKRSLDDLNSAKNITISIANKIYVQDNFRVKADFRSTAQTYFDADIERIDFSENIAAANEINDWVKKKTNNKIQIVVDPFNFRERILGIFLNAIYFKGTWLWRFKKDATRSQTFYVSEDQTISHPMMRQTASFDYAENGELDAKILKMNYKNERFSMIIFLPNSKMGINDLEKKISNIDLNNLRTRKADVKVTLPKFKIESTIPLEDPLKNLGLEEIFNGTGNLANMVEYPSNFYFNKFIQKAFIEVNEEGAEAAAVTAGFSSMTLPSMPPIIPTFTADHPFIFFLTAKLGEESTAGVTVLFAGKVVSPTY
ncbi:serine protease inhibitor serpin [Holotrichia oblita]|nr:serine protease inhibitor serpin [Holotrichia oblita]